MTAKAGGEQRRMKSISVGTPTPDQAEPDPGLDLGLDLVAAQLPNSFTYEIGIPPSSGQGYWSTGSIDGSPEGITALLPVSQSNLSSVGFALLPAGDASAPTLVCSSTPLFGDCEFTKQQ